MLQGVTVVLVARREHLLEELKGKSFVLLIMIIICQARLLLQEARLTLGRLTSQTTSRSAGNVNICPDKI